MSNLSTYLMDKLLDHYMGDTSYSKPTTYLALFTAAPTMPAGSGGTEVTGGSYARLALSGLLGSAGSGSKSNTSACSFVTATADWGTILGVGIMDASSSGNILEYGALGSSKVIDDGDTFVLPIGDLVAALS